MNDSDLLKLFAGILGRLLFDDTIVLTRETVRTDVNGWDSFNYITFIAAVEQELKIRFRVADIESFETVGDIIDEAKRLSDA